ncbi:peptide-methionine (R)-S-oxide reductase MsrB [Pseudodesulfovibrio sp. F-1]|uniref:Multifunctional fusion protein n=2 Tax=Pseudodesulfovibrio alkaliphilus TaxID=2661613 RepID=A0A7K1KPP6_9BACT|nr:peptide-methionine (R)-S-oxide reductase MsrB [Pseudodesulfovibrio alkaliphilus]
MPTGNVRVGVAETDGDKEAEMGMNARTEVATLAGGCFWCVEADMARLPGVVRVVSGYAGGQEVEPSYEDVAGGRTGHREAVQVYFDPERVSYSEILAHFWRHFDPTDAGGSFGDRGEHYTSAIYYHDDAQREIAEASRAALEASGRFDRPVVTSVLPLTTFFEAEAYHQDFAVNNAVRYKTYRTFSGRDRFLRDVWDRDSSAVGQVAEGREAAGPKYTRPDDASLQGSLTPLQFEVVRRDGTEPPFANEFWDNRRPGIYVDVVSGEPLFSSTDKFDSGTGWPSFTRPLFEDAVTRRRDGRLLAPRTEVRSRMADSHLGHVFDDGPPPTGLRYCINSAALRFVPRESLEEEGYGEFAGLFR